VEGSENPGRTRVTKGKKVVGEYEVKK